MWYGILKCLYLYLHIYACACPEHSLVRDTMVSFTKSTGYKKLNESDTEPQNELFRRVKMSYFEK